MVKIEEGKFYRTRDGRRIGPATRIAERELGTSLFRWRVGSMTYLDDGTSMSIMSEHPGDIIGEDLGVVGGGNSLRDVLEAIKLAIDANPGAKLVRVGNQTWARQPEPPAPELPKWKSHKIVQAGLIQRISHETSGIRVYLDIGTRIGMAFYVSKEWVERASAMALKEDPNGHPSGGYYVRYADGYESWSPPKAFEEGYSRLPYGSHDVDSVIGDKCICGVTREQLLDGLAGLECPQRPFKR
jgi:hypothetical protein